MDITYVFTLQNASSYYSLADKGQNEKKICFEKNLSTLVTMTVKKFMNFNTLIISL